MANPLVRPFLHFFPEVNGNSLGNAYEAHHWLNEMEGELLTPVIARGSQKFYIFEPAILEDHTCCVLMQWFMHFGQLYTKAWRMRHVRLLGKEGWVPLEYDFLMFPVSRLAVSFPYFEQSFRHRDLPNPTNIIGELCWRVSVSQ